MYDVPEEVNIFCELCDQDVCSRKYTPINTAS